MSTGLSQPNDWAHEKEDWDFLQSLPVADDDSDLMQASYEEIKLDPREVLRTENQKNMGSCRGHSGTTGMEWVYTLKTGEIGKQLSRMMLYIETQRRDGITTDAGATISGGIKQKTEVGICDERLWPYPARYSRQRPSNWAEVLADAAKQKIGRAQQTKTYESVRTWLGSGQGYVDVGSRYRPEYYNEVVERFNGGSGGHAVVLICLNKTRVDSRGRPFVDGVNSHGLNTGKKGWFSWSPAFVEAALRDPMTVMVGCSDMPNAIPRKFTLEEWKAKLKA